MLSAMSCTGVGAAAADVVPGLYVCGWLKRGPTGIIGTNLTDAEETVHSITQDEAAFNWAAPGRAALQAVLQQRGVRVVGWSAWEQLNAAEVAAGDAVGAARVKQVMVDDMLAAAGA
jgi:adrenodoxin-NADP+ reductase